MNLLEAATTIATTSDIDTLFALYSQSRTYKNGGQVREQIEARTQQVASLNGYEGGFTSFRQLVEVHDNETSPLWQFPISDDLLVTHQDYPLPYSFDHFLRLFKNTYDLRGFVYLQEGAQGLMWTKYKFLKDNRGVIRFYVSTRFAAAPLIAEYAASTPAYEEYTLDAVPSAALTEMFQPAEYLRVWDVQFASSFYEKVDAFVDGVPVVYRPLTDDGEVQFEINNIMDRRSMYMEVFDYGKMKAKWKETQLTLVRKEYSLTWRGHNEETRKLLESHARSYIYVKLSNPTPYRELPEEERYATYSLLAAPFVDEDEMRDEEWLYTDLLNKYEVRLPGVSESRYGVYLEEVDEGKVFFVATYDLFTDAQIERFKNQGQGEYGIYVKYLPEHSGDIHYYQITYAKLGLA